ncbi:MAG: SoxR reducing system RseC family protein [Pseudomonadota bacterium]
MLEAHGLIVDTDEQCIWVEVQPLNQCCRRETNLPCDSMCMNRTLFQMFSKQRTPLKLKFTGELQVGDSVRLGVQEHMMLQGAFALYFLPIIGMLVLSVLCAILIHIGIAPNQEGLIIVSGGIGLAVGFWLGRQHTEQIWQRAQTSLILMEAYQDKHLAEYSVMNNTLDALDSTVQHNRRSKL